MADEQMQMEQETRPRTSWGRRLLRTVLVLALVAGVGYLGAWSLMPVSEKKRPVVVEIPRNWGAREIAGRLKQSGLIRSEMTFLVSGRVLGELGNLKAGEYELDASMSPVEILDKLARGDVKAYWITIPEGSTIGDIAGILERRKLVDRARFLTLAKRGGLRVGAGYGVPRRSMEGYLFPSTYKVARDVSELQLARVMLTGFQREVRRGLAAEIAKSDTGLSLDETVILASVVEREARLPEERAKIAGVLLNRLERGMRLECDATVQYALGEPKERLTYDDLKIDSPYNTYRNAGLPPGPICNPGAASIRAALKPAEHDFLFYVADGKTGGHIFSRTFDEHRAAIRRVRGE